MLSIQVVQSSHILIKVSVCGGEHNLEEITGLVRLKSEIEETAVEVDLLTQKYLLEVKVAVRLKKELKMDNGILLTAKMILKVIKLSLKLQEMNISLSLELRSIPERKMVMTRKKRKKKRSKITMSQLTQKLVLFKEVLVNQLTMVTTLTQPQMLGVTDPNSPTPMLVLVNGGKLKRTEDTGLIE
jgi:hypothetical protein